MTRILCAGLTTLDLVQRVAEFPRPDEKVTSLDAEVVTGGPAAGAALAAAALGATATLITALGRHSLAEPARGELTSAGVGLVDAAAESVAVPPVSAVSVRDTGGERSVVSRDARSLNADLVPVTPPDDADVVLVDGHYPDLATTAVAHARKRGVPVVLDAGSWKPVFDELLGVVDLAVCSADFRAPGTSSPDEQGPALLERGVDAVAVTRGAQDVLWWQAGESGRVPVPSVTPVDTLGAGDVFHGAVAAAIAGRPWRERLGEVLGYAARVAALRVECFGRDEWRRALHERADQLLRL